MIDWVGNHTCPLTVNFGIVRRHHQWGRWTKWKRVVVSRDMRAKFGNTGWVPTWNRQRVCHRCTEMTVALKTKGYGAA